LEAVSKMPLQVPPDAALEEAPARRAPSNTNTNVEPQAWPVEKDATRMQPDPRWTAAQAVVESRHFARSPLLSKFLAHVVTETLAGRQEAITEHQIGVQVFGRPENYRTVEDNIVRNYARQLRKRLAEYFAAEQNAPMRIEIPVGGYVPVFTSHTVESENGTAKTAEATLPGDAADVSILQTSSVDPAATKQHGRMHRMRWRAAVILAYSAALIAGTVLVLQWHARAAAGVAEPSRALWHALFEGSETTYIVPPDAGFNLVEDISHRSVPLAEYMNASYSDLPMPQLDAHSVDDLRSQQLTDFVDVQLMVALSRLKEYHPGRVFLRFPRDLRLDDLKNANAILIGSVCSNPWAAVKDAHAGFVIVCSDGMQGSSILNRAPRSGEEAKYASHWNEPTHETYALISYLPNLSGSGHLLLLEGLDVAGTQAAAEAMLESEAIVPILKQARRADGSIAPFEVLLKATSIQANATDTQVIASRIH
jgi:hypothetical protein